MHDYQRDNFTQELNVNKYWQLCALQQWGKSYCIVGYKISDMQKWNIEYEITNDLIYNKTIYTSKHVVHESTTITELQAYFLKTHIENECERVGVSNNPDSEKEKEVEGHGINGTERGSIIISQQCGSNNVGATMFWNPLLMS